MFRTVYLILTKHSEKKIVKKRYITNRNTVKKNCFMSLLYD